MLLSVLIRPVKLLFNNSLSNVRGLNVEAHTHRKLTVVTILQGRLLQWLRILAQMVFFGFSVAILPTAWAGDNALNPKANNVNITSNPNTVNVEELFMQGQQSLVQSNLALAQLCLSRLPTASPYAKLLAGNIAAHNGDVERAFLLLLPLQANISLSKDASASLHESLSDIYAQQGDTANALDQLLLRETFLTAPMIDTHHERIWTLLGMQALHELIMLRGELNNTSAQGWIDLRLASEQPDLSASILAWSASYPDHVASEFAQRLLTKRASLQSGQQTNTLPTNDAIAIIISQATSQMSAEAIAFYQGVKAALAQRNLQNALRVYISSETQDSVNEQYAVAKNEGAMYFMAPKLETSWHEDCNARDSAIRWQDLQTGNTVALHHADYAWADETRTIIHYAANNAMRNITIIGNDDAISQQLAGHLQQMWTNALGTAPNIIKLPQMMDAQSTDLLDLKAKINSQPHDMLILTLSGSDARFVRPYLDISTPVFAYSRIHDAGEERYVNLNAVRFAEAPFLLNLSAIKPSDIDAAQTDTQPIERSTDKRLFALGYDYLELLLQGATAANQGAIIQGLSGKLTIREDGCIQREPVIARFTDHGAVLDQ